MDITELQRRLNEAPSLQEVCREANVSRKTVQRLKSGRTGTLTNYMKVLAALDALYPIKPRGRCAAPHAKRSTPEGAPDPTEATEAEG